jgi:hypothetical protein
MGCSTPSRKRVRICCRRRAGCPPSANFGAPVAPSQHLPAAVVIVEGPRYATGASRMVSTPPRTPHRLATAPPRAARRVRQSLAQMPAIDAEVPRQLVRSRGRLTISCGLPRAASLRALQRAHADRASSALTLSIRPARYTVSVRCSLATNSAGENLPVACVVARHILLSDCGKAEPPNGGGAGRRSRGSSQTFVKRRLDA